MDKAQPALLPGPHPQANQLSDNVNLENVPQPRYATKDEVTYNIVTVKPEFIERVKRWKAELKARGPTPLTAEEEREMFLPSLEEQLGFNDNLDDYRAFRVPPPFARSF